MNVHIVSHNKLLSSNINTFVFIFQRNLTDLSWGFSLIFISSCFNCSFNSYLWLFSSSFFPDQTVRIEDKRQIFTCKFLNMRFEGLNLLNFSLSTFRRRSSVSFPLSLQLRLKLTLEVESSVRRRTYLYLSVHIDRLCW